MLDSSLFRLWKLEDGELVVRLRGSKRRTSGWRSCLPHASKWSLMEAYIYVPCSTRTVRRRFQKLASKWPRMAWRGGDWELLAVGPTEDVLEAITVGPLWCRALRRRLANADHLANHRFGNSVPSARA